MVTKEEMINVALMEYGRVEGPAWEEFRRAQDAAEAAHEGVIREGYDA